MAYHAEKEDSAKRLKENRPNGQAISDIFGVLEGGRIPCADYLDYGIQNAYNEGCTTSMEVANLLALNFRREIIYAALNYPCSWNDFKFAHTSGLIYPNFHDDQITLQRYAILPDSAFTAGNAVGR